MNSFFYLSSKETATVWIGQPTDTERRRILGLGRTARSTRSMRLPSKCLDDGRLCATGLAAATKLVTVGELSGERNVCVMQRRIVSL
jgi:hypothetical protein